MNILIDFVTIRQKSGAGEYQRRIVFSLIDHIKRSNIGVSLFALYDSSKGISYEDLRSENMHGLFAIKYIDISNRNICDIIELYKIDKFFIACAQYIGPYLGISNIRCEVICVIHDLCGEEWHYNNLNINFLLQEIEFEFPKINTNLIRFFAKPKNCINRLLWWLFKEICFRNGEKNTLVLHPIIELLKKNINARAVVVSNYTKSTLMYNYDIPDDKIIVLWSPERIYTATASIENPKLKDLIFSKTKYILMVSANRVSKNPQKAIKAFKKFSILFPEYSLLTVSYGKECFSNHIDIDFLSDGDLSAAYENCEALLYPSFFEGFGYPPIEAMRHGKIVISSNATSMPEILGDSAIYFSPIYESAIFDALLKFSCADKVDLCNKARERYNYVKDCQSHDMSTLIEMLCNDSELMSC